MSLDTSKVQYLEVFFSQGSFEEWTTANGDEYPEAFIDEWEANYNALIKERLTEIFPNADVIVEEGNNQTGKTSIDFTGDGVGYGEDDDWSYQDEIEEIVNTTTDIGNDVEAMDKVWTTPSTKAVTKAIKTGMVETPIYRLKYQDADFVFVNHAGSYKSIDMDTVDDLTDGEETWIVGSSEELAKDFLVNV